MALLALAVATLAARRFGPSVGGLAGCVQATMAWSAIRGRLAEADILLACLVAWTMVALDALRRSDRPPTLPSPARGEGFHFAVEGYLHPPPLRGRVGWEVKRHRLLARLFLVALGLTSLAKGIGFGAALIVAATALLLLWDRDRATLRALLDPPGLALAAVVGLAWPALVLARYPAALGLWTSHVADRLSEAPELFAGRSSWWAYLPAVLGLTLPWAPLALFGAWTSLRRALRDRFGPDRLLWAWAVGPLALLSMATVKNAHYAIHALPPWSIWTAIGLMKVGNWLEARGRCPERMGRRIAFVFVVLAVATGLGLGVISPRFDRRGREWAFYEDAGRHVAPGEPVVILYDDWDRLPYPSPFGPMPHDLAIRLYYLGHSPICARARAIGRISPPPLRRDRPRPRPRGALSPGPRRAGGAGAAGPVGSDVFAVPGHARGGHDTRRCRCAGVGRGTPLSPRSKLLTPASAKAMALRTSRSAFLAAL